MSKLSRQLTRKKLREIHGNAMAKQIWQSRPGAGDSSGRHPGRGDYQQVRMSQHNMQAAINDGSVRIDKRPRTPEVRTPTLREKFQRIGAFVRGLFSRKVR